MSLSLMTSITGQATLVRLRRTLSSSGSSHPTLHSTCESRNVRTSPAGRSHGHHQALTPQAPHRLTVPQPHTLALPKISPGSRATAGGAGDPDGCLLTPSGARQPGLAPQDALLPATCEPPAPQLCSPEPLGRAVARCLLSTVSAEQFCSAVFSCPPRELSEGSQGELVQVCGRASPYLWQPAPPPAWPVSGRASL